jgi:hypothetical protein
VAGVAGFCSFEATGVLVIAIAFHEYLKNIFQVHGGAGASMAEYKAAHTFIVK